MQKQQFINKQQAEVGIKYYLSEGQQLLGITKFLISDFVVNEVDLNNNVVTFKEKPKNQQIDKTEKQMEDKLSQDLNTFEISEQKKKLIIEKLGEEIYAKIQNLYQKLDVKQKVGQWSIKFKGPQSKIQRTQLHNFIRENLPFIDSKTDNGEITINYAKTFKRVKKNGQYIYFKLLKSNIDTMSAIYKLSKILGVSQKLFGSAGLKDKRGITTQYISLYNCQKEIFNKFYKVASRTKELWIAELEEGHQKCLAMGDLYGNKFGLIIRFTKSREQIMEPLKKNLSSLEKNGFINYFGMQRFGRGTIRTHEIGIKILKRNWQEVIENLVLQDVNDPQINRIKKELYEKGEYKKAERMVPNKYQIQKNLFYGLTKHGTNYAVVFESLPRSSRMIYGHALQSYIWNRVVSNRIQKYGNQLMIGDIVAKNKLNIKPQEEELQEVMEEVIEEEYETQLVTKQNISQYSIFDVVVPIFGAKTIIPEQAIVKPLIQYQLEQLGLSIQSFIKGMPKSLYLQGGFRKMLSRPEQLEWCVTNYKTKNEELQNGFYYLDSDVDSLQGKLFGLKIRFILPKSSYATMLIREVLKLPTSFDIQQILNKQYASLNID